jgi:hypothetical protein
LLIAPWLFANSSLAISQACTRPPRHRVPTDRQTHTHTHTRTRAHALTSCMHASCAQAAFAASQLDWRAMQQSDPQEWMRVAATTFAQLDEDHDGILSQADIASVGRSCLEAV